MNKQTFTIGFMLFALFFGAGNLIYPPTLGSESGTSYWTAIIGFVITGVGLPILAVTAISFVKNDARELANRVHPVFGLIFASVVYLSIGPFFGIPRAATTGYEMSITPITGDTSALSLFIFTTVFFMLVFLMSFNPSKMVDRIGKLLTPILLLAIVLLVIGAFYTLDQPVDAPIEKYASSSFFSGFVEGYLTMDAIAALAFGIIVVQAFKDRGFTTQQGLVRSTLKAGLVAGVGLVAVYISLGWIGTKLASTGTYDNGGDILSSSASMIFSNFGALLLGVIVTLACLTTSIGLVVACGEFFAKVTPLSYKTIITVISLLSYIIANQGLEAIISYSVPVLTFIYPITIVLILLTFMQKFFQGSKAVYRGAILLTAITSLYEGLVEYGLDISVIKPFMESLPFFSYGLGWVVPAVIGGVIGLLFHKTAPSTKKAT